MKSRAVLRYVQPANESVSADCPACGITLKFSARNKPTVVIANVYRQGRWVRTEHWHPDCYEDNGSPHGEVDPAGSARRPLYQSKR